MENKMSGKDYLYIIFGLILVYLVYTFTKEKKPEGSLDLTLPVSPRVQSAFSDTWFIKKAKTQPSPYNDVNKLGAKFGYDSTRLVQVCKTIFEAKGTFNDDETIIYNAYLSVPNIYICGMVAYSFKFIYKVNILDYLQTFLSEKELEKLYSIIDKKKELRK